MMDTWSIILLGIFLTFLLVFAGCYIFIVILMFQQNTTISSCLAIFTLVAATICIVLILNSVWEYYNTYRKDSRGNQLLL